MTSPRQKEQRGEAFRAAPVSLLAWHVICGKTQSRGTHMAEYKEGSIRCSKIFEIQ